MVASLSETNNAEENKLKTRKQIIMGDNSPKSKQKQASQKQSKNNATNQKKQQAIVAKQTPKKK